MDILKFSKACKVSIMKIKVHKMPSQAGSYSLSIDGTVYTLDTWDLKKLVMASVRALSPDVLPESSWHAGLESLMAKISLAHDDDIQEFIMNAKDSDLLIFLKCSEDAPDLHQKVFANMSDRKRVLLSEDLQFRFQDDIDDKDLNASMTNLIAIAARAFG